MSGAWEWNRITLLIVILVALLCGLAACGGGKPAGDSAALDPSGEAGMPQDLAGLDALKGTTEIRYGEVDVTTPLLGVFTTVNGENLDFDPPELIPAWALYRIEPPNEEPRTLSADGSGPLWLLVADYGASEWVYAEFTGGSAVINLQELSDCTSPLGYIYAMVVCEAGGDGTLTALELGSYYPDAWELDLGANQEGISLGWAEFDCDGYNIYRSTLADDGAPYLVGYVAEAHSGENTFDEAVPEDTAGRWVPERNDNSTAADTTDDFPALAPGIEYYYRIYPVTGGVEGEPSPKIFGTVPWGTRRMVQRALPDTTDQTACFYVSGAWDTLTAAQRNFVANHYCGGMVAPQSTADELRDLNGDFVLLGSRYGFLAYDVRQSEFWDYAYGEETDDIDGDYPYINRHEDWFIHDATSSYDNNRVLLMNPPSEAMVVETGGQWPEFNADALLERLGEDCYDGWSLEYLHNRFATDPVIEDSIEHMCTDFDYVNNMVDDILTGGSSIFAQHPLEPMLFAEVMDGMCADYTDPMTYTEVSLDFPGCDGVIVPSFLGSWNESVAIMKFETFFGPQIIGWQNAGKAVILRDLGFSRPRSFGFCCYLLLRGPRTYFESYHYRDLYWSDVCAWDTGAPLAAYPTSLDELKVQNVDEAGNPVDEWYYRRDYANGSVIIIPGNFDIREPASSGKVYEYLSYWFTEVDDDGNYTETFEWLPVTEDSEPGFLLEGGSPYSWIIREVTE